MRFYDFICDVAQTSERIAQRNAHVPSEVSAQMTIKTLMRHDVIAFFDTLVEAEFKELPSSLLIIFYLVMFGYAVNIRPRTSSGDLKEFSERVLKIIGNFDKNESSVLLCDTGSNLKPKAVFNRINKVLNIKSTSGFYCAFSSLAPSKILIEKLSNNKFNDASLLLYNSASVSKESLFESENKRILYSGDIFHSPTLGISGVYISANCD